MDTLILFAEGFIGMFNKGGETLIGWVSGIIPTLVCLLVAMNAIVLFVGNERVEKFAHLCAGNPISRYVVLPFIGVFFLCNGMFPHVNPGEMFVFLGVANGITTLGLPYTDLALRYLLVGLIVNFLRGWLTDFTTAYVQRQQGVQLSKEPAVLKS